MAVSFTLNVALGTLPINGVLVDLFDLTTSTTTPVGTLTSKRVGGTDGVIDSTAAVACWTANPARLRQNRAYKLSFQSPTITVADPTANPVRVAATGASGTTLLLQGPQDVYFTLTSTTTALPLGTFSYEVAGCLLSGTVQRELPPPAPPGTQGPLANVGIDMVDPTSGAVLDHAATDAQGRFCFLVGPKNSQRVTLRFPPNVTDSGDSLTLAPNEISCHVNPSSQNKAPSQAYKLALATVTGRVTDGNVAIPGVTVELFYPKTGQSSPQTSDAMGYFQFSNVSPGPIELRFPGVGSDKTGKTWELQAGQSGTQSLTAVRGQVQQAGVVVYQPELHAIVWTVTGADGRPAPDKLVEVHDPKNNDNVVAAGLTGADGTVRLNLAASGTYTVVVYPYAGMTGKVIQSTVSVRSVSYGSTTIPAPSERGGEVRESIPDLQSYPVLTEEVPAGVMPTTTGPATAGPIGGTSPLGLTADKAIREVLSWRTKSNDPKGFLLALGQAFDLKEVEGRTQWSWTPRSYTVQTDMGAVTGAQASIYTRAKVALDQSLPLLDGLYPLLPNVEPEDLATVQSVVRTQFTALVNEFGVVGGPRVARVDELFMLLLGHDDPERPPTRPEDIGVKGSLGLVNQRFGFNRKFVTTVDDEQDLTNYLILVDYVISLNRSWIDDKNYFIRDGIKKGFSPFFGTQLVLLSRALDVVAQSVQDAYFAMDSVFMGDAERQVAQLNFAGLWVHVLDPETGLKKAEQFGEHTSGLFVAELLDWVDRSASTSCRACFRTPARMASKP